MFTVNPITNNYARILCRLQYTFYRASFLIVIRIHRGINTNRSYWSTKQQPQEPLDQQLLSHWNTAPATIERQPLETLERRYWGQSTALERQPLESIKRQLPPPVEPLERQPLQSFNGSLWSCSHNSHWSHWNDVPGEPPESIER